MRCPTCGRENEADARFCAACGTNLAAGVIQPEARKVVTVLFTDIAGSTALGERLDPELLRRIMWRYFETVREVLERHGGTVEKFIGDAVMAVFGVPAVREDDPLRAVRAAAELGDALGALNEELTRRHGVEIAIRTGVNTGEVMVGAGAPGQTLALGDAVNVAARLEQAAPPGDVLIGDATYRAVADAVRAEAVPPLAAKGKADPLVAYRLVALGDDPGAFGRPVTTPFVGRRDELDRLRGAFDSVVATGSPALATIVGAPGIGKSRLARELLDALAGEARVLTGRCASYGDGVPYLPLADVVRDAGDVRQLLAADGHAEAIARLVHGAVGAREGGGSPEETAWAFRRVFETLAATQPLVLVVDDIQWADPTLLDLIEHVAGAAEGALFILCTARPDLLDVRPAWTAPRVRTTLVVLDPLGRDDSEALVSARADELAPALRERVVSTAEGNPLFVEQLLAHLADHPETDTVPPTIQALLAARIDRLEPAERAVVQRGSVEGRLFHRGAVAELLDESATVGETLGSLARKELVRPDRSLFPGDDGFRFNHVLIRDVAYASMPKALRARLHARLADWLDAQNGHLEARHEIVGYHLEQAHWFATELGHPDRDRALRAGRLLAHAGGAALARGEPVAAAALMERASALLADEPAERAALLPGLGHALRERGALAAADRVLAEAIELARSLGDEQNELRAAVERGHLSHMLGTSGVNELRTIAERAINVFDNAADLSDAFQLLGTGELQARNRRAQQAALRRAHEYATASGDIVRQVSAWNELGGSMLFGPTPLPWVKAFFDAELEWARERALPALEAGALLGGPYVDARVGDFDVAREKLARSRTICRELGIAYGLAEAAMAAGELEVLAGDLPAAERELEEAIALAADMEAAHYVVVYQVRLARVLNDQGRHEEADAVLKQAASLYDTRPWWKSNRARVLAAQGEIDEAVTLAREAAAEEDGDEDPTSAALTLMDLAEVLRAAGDDTGAEAAVSEAVALNEQKGNTVAARQCRERLAAIQA